MSSILLVFITRPDKGVGLASTLELSSTSDPLLSSSFFLLFFPVSLANSPVGVAVDVEVELLLLPGLEFARTVRLPDEAEEMAESCRCGPSFDGEAILEVSTSSENCLLHDFEGRNNCVEK